MFGRQYVIDHCTRKIVEGFKRKALVTYVTDALKVITENTGGLTGNGKSMSKRFDDLFKPEETRTAEEIIDSIKTRLEG